MPAISIRGTEMPASPIRKLAPLAEAAKQRGVHVFHLNIGQPDLPTPQVAIDAIRNIDRKVLEYSPSAGYRSYREKQMISSLRPVVRRQYCSPSWRASIRVTRLLFPNRLTLTIWRLPSLPVLRYVPLPLP